MVTAKLLNYTFVPRSESSMQIAPPKGDDDVVVVPCLKEREGFSQWSALLPSCNNPISVLDSGEIFPLSRAHNTPHFTADPSLPAADFTRPPRPPLSPSSHFIKLRRPFTLYDLHLAEISVQRVHSATFSNAFGCGKVGLRFNDQIEPPEEPTHG